MRLTAGRLTAGRLTAGRLTYPTSVKRLLLLPFLLLLFSACDTADIAQDGTHGLRTGLQTGGPPSTTAAEARAVYADHPFTFDAVLSEVSRSHPGLKGVAGTGEGESVQVLLGASALGAPGAVVGAVVEALELEPAAATAALAPIVTMRHPASFDLSPVPTVERPDFHVLYDIRIGLRRFLMETELVTMLDIDDEAGRVLLGTRTIEDAVLVLNMMEDDELAVTEFVHAEPAVPAVETTTASHSAVASGASSLRSLRFDRFRPLIGGAHTLQILPGGEEKTCTNGPAVRYSDGTFGFLTNAHCTGDFSRVNDVPFYQVAFVESERTGTEAAVPPYRSGWFITNGYFSDAAFIRAGPEVPLEGKMTSADDCWAPRHVGDCVENGLINNITRTVSYLPINTGVFKTGQTTGTSAGRITQVCADYGNPRILCSSVVSRDPAIPTGPSQLGWAGDSGAPVLLREGIPGTENGALAGLLWGYWDDGDRFVFSPWENIWQNERAGTQYGLAVQAVTAAHGVVQNPAPPPPPPPPPPPCEPSENQLCPDPND